MKANKSDERKPEVEGEKEPRNFKPKTIKRRTGKLPPRSLLVCMRR